MQSYALFLRRSDNWLLGVSVFIAVALLLFIFSTRPPPNQIYTIQQADILEEGEHLLSVAEVMALPSSMWRTEAINTGLGMGLAPQWVKFTLDVPIPPQQKWILEVDYPLLDQLDIWLIDPTTGKPLRHRQMGDSFPFTQRDIQAITFAMPVTDTIPQTVVMRVETKGTLKLPISVMSKHDFMAQVSDRTLMMGVFFGILLTMGLNNFFFFITTRRPIFVVYSAYVLFLAGTLAALTGVAYKYLWPESPWFQSTAIAILANAATFFAVIFTYYLLDIGKQHHLIRKVFVCFITLFGVSFFASFVLPYTLMIKAFLVILSFKVLFVVGVSVWLAFHGVMIARYYTAAWIVLFSSVLFAALDHLHFIQVNVSSSFMLMYGATVETLLLAIVLALSFSRQQKEMLDAQAQALELEKSAVAAKEELIEMKQRTQEELEYKVGERTLELEITLRELSEANQELEKLNTIDPLTGIRNRRHFDKRLLAEGRRSRREQTALSLAVVDLDNFKQINDTYGHLVGDACIQHVATVLRDMLKRPSDDVCRYGGEEFGIILPNTELDGAQQLIEAIRETVEKTPVLAEGHEIHMTISAGVASAVMAFEDQEKLLFQQADKLLYAAKQAGRNQVKASTLQDIENA